MVGENLAELISNPEITTSQLDTVDSFRWTYRNRTLSPSLQAGRIAPLINTRKKNTPAPRVDCQNHVERQYTHASLFPLKKRSDHSA